MSNNNIDSNVSLKPINDLTKRVKDDSFNEWESIGKSSFTVGFVIESLRSNDKEFIDKYGTIPVKKVTFYDISQGKGFASIVYKVTVHFDTNDNEDVYTTILKVPGTESLNDAFNENTGVVLTEELIEKVANAHEFECQFYNNVAPLIDVPIPKVYKTLPWIKDKKDGVIHMNDLSSVARTLEMYESLSASQILDVTKHLIRMHKNTLMDKTWIGKYTMNHDIFNDICKMVSDSLEAFFKICDQETKQLILKYKNIVVSKKYIQYAFVDSWKDLNIPPVLVHGDMWGGNIMWSVDQFGHPTSSVKAFVDWQIMHEGSIMADLARVLICTDGDVRRRLEQIIFDFYHQELYQLFKNENMECPVTLEKIKEAYNIMYITQAGMLPLMVIIVDNLKNKEKPDVIKARVDRLTLRVKHAYQDIDKLAQNELKDIFNKYNVE